MTSSRYRVHTGYSFAFFSSAERAEQNALVLARKQAEDDGINPNTVAIYDLRSRGGDWGACPEGDEGGYYPRIEEIEDL